jgi:hypothetical protein
LALSFARAIQQPALEIWHGEECRVLAAQQALYRRASCNRAARRGEYNAARGHEHHTKDFQTLAICGIATVRRRRIKPGAGQPEAIG